VYEYEQCLLIYSYLCNIFAHLRFAYEYIAKYTGARLGARKVLVVFNRRRLRPIPCGEVILARRKPAMAPKIHAGVFYFILSRGSSSATTAGAAAAVWEPGVEGRSPRQQAPGLDLAPAAQSAAAAACSGIGSCPDGAVGGGGLLRDWILPWRAVGRRCGS